MLAHFKSNDATMPGMPAGRQLNVLSAPTRHSCFRGKGSTQPLEGMVPCSPRLGR